MMGRLHTPQHRWSCPMTVLDPKPTSAHGLHTTSPITRVRPRQSSGSPPERSARPAAASRRGSADIGRRRADLLVESMCFGVAGGPMADSLAGLMNACPLRIAGNMGGEVTQQRGELDTTGLRLRFQLGTDVVIEAD